MTPKAVHDYLRTEFDPTLPEFEKLAPGIKTDFSDLVATVSKSGATPGNAYEEAIAAGLATIAEIEAETGKEVHAIGVMHLYQHGETGRRAWAEESPGDNWTEEPFISEAELPADITADDKQKWLSDSMLIDGVVYGSAWPRMANVNTPALSSEDIVELVTPADKTETETTDAGSDETEQTPKRKRK